LENFSQKKTYTTTIFITWDQREAMLEAEVAETPEDVNVQGRNNTLFNNHHITCEEIASYSFSVI
jgi:hypothetical protein